jgi:hypothetical protein
MCLRFSNHQPIRISSLPLIRVVFSPGGFNSQGYRDWPYIRFRVECRKLGTVVMPFSDGFGLGIRIVVGTIATVVQHQLMEIDTRGTYVLLLQQPAPHVLSLSVVCRMSERARNKVTREPHSFAPAMTVARIVTRTLG